MRLFFGIFLPETVVDRITQIADGLRRSMRPSSAVQSEVRWTPRAQIHITLQFLGNCDDLRADAARAAATRVGPRHASFRARVGGLGAFPDPERPRVLWASVRGAAPLVSLADDLGRELAAEGFTFEERAYHPHVTIARIKERRAMRAASHALEQSTDEDAGEVLVDAFDLIESRTSQHGSEYTSIGRFTLAAPIDAP